MSKFEPIKFKIGRKTYSISEPNESRDYVPEDKKNPAVPEYKIHVKGVEKESLRRYGNVISLSPCDDSKGYFAAENGYSVTERLVDFFIALIKSSNRPSNEEIEKLAKMIEGSKFEKSQEILYKIQAQLDTKKKKVFLGALSYDSNKFIEEEKERKSKSGDLSDYRFREEDGCCLVPQASERLPRTNGKCSPEGAKNTKQHPLRPSPGA